MEYFQHWYSVATMLSKTRLHPFLYELLLQFTGSRHPTRRFNRLCNFSLASIRVLVLVFYVPQLGVLLATDCGVIFGISVRLHGWVEFDSVRSLREFAASKEWFLSPAVLCPSGLLSYACGFNFFVVWTISAVLRAGRIWEAYNRAVIFWSHYYFNFRIQP